MASRMLSARVTRAQKHRQREIAMTAQPRALGLLTELTRGGLHLDPSDTVALLERRGAGQPERWLALDVLLKAMDDALSTPRGPRDATRDAARAWLLDDSKGYSARLCCDALGIDYDAMRARVAKAWGMTWTGE